MPITIVEIVGRSDQGRTEPFICRGDDGFLYYVKGRSAGRESQIKEHICGHLALALDLPIATFATVEVPKALITSDIRSDLRDLGSGPAFGSRSCSPATEITYSQMRKVPERLARDILVFDWWIRNGDRILSAEGGNPNLLWDQARDRLVIIDHNLAFDRKFDPSEFSRDHVFQALLDPVFGDLAERLEYGSRLKKALNNFQAICDTLPEEWIDEAPAWLDLAVVETILNHCDRQDFWAI
jgi:hypothetical protein